MRVLLAGASGAVGTPLTGQLIAANHQVIGITRSQINAERLRKAGAEAVVGDVMDRENLLTALRQVRADAVIHQLTALGTRKIREGIQGTNNLRTTGLPTSSRRPGWSAPTASSPSRTCSGTATGITDRA
jgi:nucleoside-diphosphate-sugar epimerase